MSICLATKKNGDPCRAQAHAGGYCAQHGPHRASEPDADLEDQAQEAQDEIGELRRQIAAQKAELEALQDAPTQPVAKKRLSPEHAALQKELRNLRLRAAQHLKQIVDWNAAGRKGLPPHYLSDLPHSEDGSEVPNDPETGEPVVPKGMVPVWVSFYDQQGRDDTEPAQVRMRKQRGYQTAHYGDGKEVRCQLGVLMFATPLNAALWAERGMRPGSTNPSDYFAAQVEMEADAINSAVGVNALNVTRQDDHGTRTRITSPLEDPNALFSP